MRRTEAGPALDKYALQQKIEGLVAWILERPVCEVTIRREWNTLKIKQGNERCFEIEIDKN